MNADCAICYVSDINFLLPSLVSAAGVRKYVPAHKADIYVFLIDEPARIEELNRHLEPYAIRVLSMDSGSYSDFDAAKFRQTGIPTSSLGRFSMEGMLPEKCQRIVYIDGDTWIRRDPSALVEAIVPEGRFAAAEDIVMSLRRSSLTPHGRFLRSYYKGIGLDWKKNGYFNAGVFAVSRKTWRGISDKAFKFFKEHTDLCHFHDQSALNATVGDRRLRLSTRWNCQTAYRYMNAERAVEPRIYHFTQYPKPWMGPCEPWKEIYPQYQEAVKPFESLNLPLKKVGADMIASHNKLNLKKRILLQSPLAAEIMSACLGYRALERKAWL